MVDKLIVTILFRFWCFLRGTRSTDRPYNIRATDSDFVPYLRVFNQRQSSSFGPQLGTAETLTKTKNEANFFIPLHQAILWLLPPFFQSLSAGEKMDVEGNDI